MRYRVRFLSRDLRVITELVADARSAEGAIALIADYKWPPGAFTLLIVDLDQKEIYRISKDQIH